MSMYSIALLVAFLSSLLLTPLVRAAGRRFGLLDVPNERSSHSVPTPGNGGYAIVAAIAIATGIGWSTVDSQILWIAVSGLAIAVMGAVDDRRPMREAAKFLVQVTVAIALMLGSSLLVSSLDLPFLRVDLMWMAPVFTLLWLVGYTNAFNFMDGINGIAATHAMVAGLVLAILLAREGDVAGAVLAVAIAGASAGFLPWNLPSGSIFMGDVGSVTIGFLLASLVVRYTRLPGGEFLPAILPMMPFILDTSITLVRRILRRERFFSAHRSHFYQRLTMRGFSHTQATLVWTAMAVVSAVPAVFWRQIGSWERLVSVAVLIFLHLAVFAWIAERGESQEMI
jgi:UDP-GlcNAc:undecaprenyl-phosphate/decaprenyl-phosphate GlcNAc-1-phosphate transferase